MAAFLVASGAVGVATVVLASRLAPRGPVAFLVALGLIGWTIVDVTVGFAGLVVRDLSGTTLLALSIVWLAAAVWLLRRPTDRHRLTQHGRAVLIAGRLGLRWLPVSVATVLVVVMLGWRLVLIGRLPIVDLLGWQYHLVTVGGWLQANAIVPVLQTWWSQGYPADGELLTTWLAAFTHSDALTGLTGLLPIPIGILAVVGLGRSFGAGRGPALLGGLLFGMTPAMVALAGTTYVDPASAAALAVVWWLGLRFLRGDRNLRTVFLFSIAAGLAIGTKQSNPPLAFPMVAGVGLVLAWMVLRDIRTAGGASRAAVWAVAYLGPVLVLGVSWYLKNLLLYGNPAFPFTVGPFAGTVTTASLTTASPLAFRHMSLVEQVVRSWLHDWHLSSYPYNVRPGGFGLAWPLLGVLALGGALLMARRRDVAALGFVLAPAAIVLVIAPDAWYARHTLFVLGAALPLAALALDALRPRVATAIAIAVVLVAACSLGLANVEPNVPITLRGGALQRAGAYLEFVLTASDDTRSRISLRAQCTGASAIPTGARVAVDFTYSVPHAIAGPSFDRILTAPVAGESTPAQLAQALADRGAGWLVTRSNGQLAKVAAQDPARFIPVGSMCRGQIFRFAP